MSSSIDWNDVIKKEARGSNDEDLGEVQEVSNGYVLVKRGIINKEEFYLPRDKAVDYDGRVLRFSISEDEMKSQYTEMGTGSTSESQSENQTTEGETDEKTIPLTEEKLDVSKKTQEQQVSVTKESETR